MKKPNSKISFIALALCLLFCLCLLPNSIAAEDEFPEIEDDDVFSEERIEPTCTECGHRYVYKFGEFCFEEEIPALGHNYIETIVTAATCEKTGLTRYTCSRCGNSYETVTPASGHNYKKTTVEPSCEEDGEEVFTCTKCKDTYTNILPALGHETEEKERIEASCTEDGKIISYCTRCKQEYETIIPAKGHQYGEWIVETEPTAFKEGLKYALCSVCNDRIEETIPKLSLLENKAVVIFISVGAAGTAGVAAFFIAKARTAKRLVEALTLKPSFKLPKKTIIACLKDNEINNGLFSLLDSKSYINLKSLPYSQFSSLGEQSAIIQPHLIILNIDSSAEIEELKETIALLNKAYATNYGLIVNTALNDELKFQLNKLKEDGIIIGYATKEEGLNNCLIKLVMPLYKFKKNKNAIATNISLLAQAAQLPLISNILTLYVNSRNSKFYLEEIKNTINKGEMGSSEVMAVIANLGSLLGYDTLRDLFELFEDIKDALKKEN